MTHEELEKIISDFCDQNREYFSFRAGEYVIQPIHWSEDNNGNINYDTETMEDEFRTMIIELEDHNENTEFEW